MPYVVSSNPVKLKLAAKVHLPPKEPTLVDPKQWADCMKHPITQNLMARGMVKLCSGPEAAAKPAPEPEPKEPKSKKGSGSSKK